LVTEHDQAAAELRQDELMCVAAGYSLPSQMLFKQFNFPKQIAQKAALRI
jgi:hypothetical protein